MDWDSALDLVAGELRRVHGEHGPSAVYGGSYGWASAGRFHHAQSQLKRFLALAGGFTNSVNNYSYGATEPFLPHVFVGEHTWESLATSWPVIAEHTELFVAFGGLPRKNTAVASGGNAHHDMLPWLRRIRAHGCRFVAVSPLADDMPAEAQADWLALRPGTDGALLQALAHVLIAEKRYDAAFVATHCAGFDDVRRRPSPSARRNGPSSRPGVAAARIVALARDMAAHRTHADHELVHAAPAARRADHLARRRGRGAAGPDRPPGRRLRPRLRLHELRRPRPMAVCRCRGSAPARTRAARFIPVARIADMLLHPGDEYDYNGRRLRYPDIRLVYWAGGNPFHHHQDLKRLRRAFGRPDTVVVHDSMWTATARHADIVLPATLTVERDDFGASVGESVLFPMPALIPPHAQARDDHAILAGLAQRLGFAEEFAGGRTPLEWLETLYTEWTANWAAAGRVCRDWPSSGRPGSRCPCRATRRNR